MKIKQLSLFIENKPGRLTAPCRALANAGINIITMSLADTRQFGILHLIVRDWERARQVLEQAGMVVKVTEVLAIEVEDKPGGLYKVLSAFEKAEINIEYTYAFTEQQKGMAVLIFRVEDPDQAIMDLNAAGVNVLKSVDLYERSKN